MDIRALLTWLHHHDVAMTPILVAAIEENASHLARSICEDYKLLHNIVICHEAIIQKR